MPPKQVRVRFAPSPTGFFHVGSARSTLFNWLYAKKEGGVFVLRIEDTDKERSNPEFERIIFESLEWIGLTWDEGPGFTRADGSEVREKGSFGPYRQSERKAIYKKYLEKLLYDNHAYWCFCTPEELEAERQSLLASGSPPKYSGTCRSLPKETVSERQERGESAVIRFKMPEEKISFSDIIRGTVEFDMSLGGDVVIAKGLDQPLFDFANMIDDEMMEITHVIRGEDHIPNTPKQIAVARVLGFRKLYYAHLPLILNSDRSKMSKRFQAASLVEYQKMGYVPEALVNFLVLLGWHPEPIVDTKTGKAHEREIFSLEELSKLFDFKRVQKGGAIFNIEKLNWINNRYLRVLENKEIARRLREGGFVKEGIEESMLLKTIELIKPRMRTLKEFEELAGCIFSVPEYDGTLLVWKKSTKDESKKNLIDVNAVLQATGENTFTPGELKNALSPLTTERGNGDVLWPLRVALSGKEFSPGPFEIMSVLGKNESMRRITEATAKL
jgi:glutamyl-tRNA synthetase